MSEGTTEQARSDLAVCDDAKLVQKRLRALAQATSLAMIVTNDHESVDVDHRYRELTGVEFDAGFRSLHPDDREHALSALDRRDAAIPCRLHQADGSWRHVEFRCVDSYSESVTVVVDNQQPMNAVAKLTNDITQLQRQMDQRTSKLQNALSNLSERNTDLGSFAHAAAHDLKAPLRAVIAFSGMAIEALGEEHAAHSFVARIEQSSARMSNMVDNLLELASAGSSALAIRSCAVEPIVRQVCSDLGHEIDQVGAIVDVHAIDPVLADPTALGVILTNLVSNSVKYRSERTPRIDISSATQDHRVTITVSDNGIGFDQTKAAQIFEPFQRLHSRDQFEGSGIGLAICRRLASRLDGEIWATAGLAGGAAISLRLPSPSTHS